MMPKWSSWVLRAGGGVVDLALPARLLEVEQRALEGLAGVLARLLPAEVVQQPVLGEGHRRGGGLLELQPARAEPDDRHVAVAADRRAGGLADRAEAVGDGDAGGDLEALARARAVGEAVLERLLEAAQVVGLAEGQLGLGAADGDLLALGGLAGARAGARTGQGGGGAGAGGSGGDGAVLRVRRTAAGPASTQPGYPARAAAGPRRRRGRPRPLGFLYYLLTPNSTAGESGSCAGETAAGARVASPGWARVASPGGARAGYRGARVASPRGRESLTPVGRSRRGRPVENPASGFPRCASRLPRSASGFPRCASGLPGSAAAGAGVGASRIPRVARVASPGPGARWSGGGRAGAASGAACGRRR